MKRFAISSAAIGIALVASAMSAQAQVATVLKPVRLGVALGAALPQGDLSDVVNSGYNATATLALQPVGLPVGFRIDGGFNHFAIKGGGGDFNVFGVTGNVVVPFSAGPALAPYVIGGGGYYHESVKSTLSFPAGSTFAANSSANHFGFNVGAGLNIPLSGFATFIEARYNRISEKDGSTSFIPVTVGVMF